MPETFHVVPESQHNALIAAAYQHRGFHADEASEGARFCAEASRHGIRTHNGIKALHLDHLFGSGSKGCVPGAQIEEIPSRFEAVKIWNAHKKLGQATAYRAMDEAIRLADSYGVGTVSVDNAFHYLWGGGYVMDAARRGYIAYTNCTAALAEVVPFGGKFPTLGTNPHSWGFPTTDAVGYPIVIDWATSVVAMGRVQQLKREGKPLSLIMIDVDDFKKYNDLHGHQADDQCLIAVAKTLQASAKRASDLAARYGGEEFLLVLPGMDATAAQGLAEELRRSVEALKIPHEQSRGGSVTISIGLAVMTNDSHMDVAGLLRAADEALYHAKHGGRNQVRLAAQTRRAARIADGVAANLVQLVWHPAYESGQAELDAQHRALFGHVNDILAALLLERPIDEVAALIDTLIGDVAEHFEDEEKIILAAGFPGAAAHAAMHRELIAHAGYLVSRFKTRDLDRGEPFQFLAHDLVARHILGEDREFFPHLSA